MATNDREIGIEANLDQPAAELQKLQNKLTTVTSALSTLVKRFDDLSNAKIGAVNTQAFDSSIKQILKDFSQATTLIKNDDAGGRIGKMVADRMAASLRENMTGFSKTLSQGIMGSFKDAETVIKNSPVLKLLADQNKGATTFSTKTTNIVNAGGNVTEERRLELLNRIRAAELLLASAQAEALNRQDGSLDKVIAKRERELAVLQKTKDMIAQRAAEEAKAERAEASMAAQLERRALLVARQGIYGGARIGTQETIDQSVGIDRQRRDVEQLAALRAKYSAMEARDKQRAADIATAQMREEADFLNRQFDAQKKITQQINEQTRLQELSRAARQARGAAAANVDPALQGGLDAAVRAAEERQQKAITENQQNQQRLRTLGDGGQFLLEIQARLMLNYKVLTAFTSAMSFGLKSVLDFDEALHQLQAISGASKGELTDLKGVITEVAEASRYTTAEVTKAAVILAQAGYSTTQIGGALKPLTQLAQSTGSDLKTAIDVSTSAIGAFNLRAEETSSIVNQMAGALNNSKLDMEKLALGIQYSGNTAAQVGVSFSELTTLISALANTGVRSGSTLGTGLTQIFSDLTNPSDKLKASLNSVGLTLSDVDIKTKGIIPVLKTMAQAGFGAAQAFEGMELRGARAYLGLVSQTNGLETLKQAILSSNAAFDGSRVAMGSLQATSDRLKATYSVLADGIGGTLLGAFTNLLNVTTSVISAFGQMGSGAASLIVTIGGGAFVTVMTLYFLRLSMSVVKATSDLLGFRAAMMAAATGATAATGSLGTMATATATLGRALMFIKTLIPSLLIFGVFEAMAFGLFNTGKAAAEFADKLDKAKQVSNEATQSFNKQAETQTTIDKAISDLLNKYGSLTNNSDQLKSATAELISRFGDLGIQLPKTVTNVRELITALQDLKKTSQDQQLLAVLEKIGATDNLKDVQEKRAAALATRSGLRDSLENESSFWNTGNSPFRMGSRYNQLYANGRPVDENILNSKGTVVQAKDLTKVILNQNAKNEDYAKAIKDAQDALLAIRQGKIKIGSDADLDKNDQIKLLTALIKQATEITNAKTQANQAGITAENDRETLKMIEEGKKAIYESIQETYTQAQIDISALKDAVGKAPLNERRGILDQMKARIKQATSEAEQKRDVYNADRSPEDTQLSNKVYQEQAGQKFKSLDGDINLTISHVMEEVNKRLKVSLDRREATAELELKNAQKEFDLNPTADGLIKANRELSAANEKLATIKSERYKIELDGLTGAFKQEDRENLLETQRRAVLDQAEKNRLQAEANVKRLAETEARIARAQLSAESVTASANVSNAQRKQQAAPDFSSFNDASSEYIQARERQANIERQRAALDIQELQRQGRTKEAAAKEAETAALELSREQETQLYQQAQLDRMFKQDAEQKKTRLNAQMALVNEDLSNAQREAALYSDNTRVTAANEKLMAAYARAKEIRAQTNELEIAGLEKLGNSADVEAARVTQDIKEREEAQKMMTEINGNLKRVSVAEAEIYAERTQQQIRTINTRITADLAELTGKTGKGLSKEKRDAMIESIRMALEQIATLEHAALLRSLTARGEDPGSSENAKTLDLPAERKDDRWRSVLDRLNESRLSGGGHGISNELRQELAALTANMKRLSNTFKDINRDLENATKEAETIQFKFDESQKAYSAPVNRNRFSNAFAEVEAFDKAPEVANQVRQKKIEATEQALARQNNLLTEQKKLVEALQAKETSLKGPAEGNAGESAALAAVTGKLEEAKGKVDEYSDALTRNKEALARLKIEQDAQTIPKPPPTIGETLDVGFRSWVIKNQLFKDELAQLGDKIPAVLDTISGQMTQFFTSIADGSASAADAFRNMASSIIKSILSMIIQMLAMAAIKMALKAVGLDFGSIGGKSSGGEVYGPPAPPNPADNGTAWSAGGKIRKMAGGGSNRDSVRAMLMPGEYVLRRSAVEMIGTKTLDRVNTMGNRRTSGAMGAVEKAGGENRRISESMRDMPPVEKPVTTNIWLVPQGTQPPPPSEKDIVMAITNDMMRGGQTKQMIKSITSGKI